MSNIFRVFKVIDDGINDSVFVGEITNSKQLMEITKRPENNYHKFYILNEKGEEVDINLNVIIKPTTSMESLVGALQNKFSRKKR